MSTEFDSNAKASDAADAPRSTVDRTGAAATAAGAHPKGARQASSYVPEVDALRCFAVTAVVLQHCALLPFGWMGVWLFYVVSGFAITSSLLTSSFRRQTPQKTLANFLIRRCLRIWPLYFLFIGLNLAWLLQAGQTYQLRELPYLATFTFNLRMILGTFDELHPLWPAFGHLWTIAVEEQFYLIYPLLFIFLSRNNLVRALCVLLALSPILRGLAEPLLQATDWDEGHKAFAVYAFSIAHFDAFALGALAALFRDRLASNARLGWGILLTGVTIAVAYISAYAALNYQILGGLTVDVARNIISGILWGQGRQIFVYEAVTVTACGLIALLLSRAPLITNICRIPGLQWVGRISYGVYVLHLVMVMIVDNFVPHRSSDWDLARQLLVFGIAYPLTLLAAHVSFTFYEAKVLRLRHRFG